MSTGEVPSTPCSFQALRGSGSVREGYYHNNLLKRGYDGYVVILIHGHASLVYHTPIPIVVPQMK